MVGRKYCLVRTPLTPSRRKEWADLFRALSWLVAAAILWACAGKERTAGSLRDDAGYALDLARGFSRIVSLSPATTELLFDLRAGDLLVGRTRYCQDPPEALAVPSVGEGFDPNVEAVAARRPDLVVGYHSGGNLSSVQRLRAMGIGTVSLRLDRLADLARATRILGALLGRQARADSLIARLETQLDSLRAAADGSGNALLVAVVVWDNPPMVIGAGSFLSEIVELAGARNAFADIPQPSATISLETLAHRDPDFLVVFEGASKADFLSRPEWRVVRAARQRRVVLLSGSEFGHPSFRAPRGAARLKELLYGPRG
jgi:ABC-type Fe3+-hydroxamate transport system substrate-binding protein